MAKNITVIPATLDLHTGIPSHMHNKRRVAGYARVSTDNEEQLTSYEAQVDYYTQYIRANPDWQFVAVYTDEGISATNTKRRDGFNRMVQDALDGKIDLIVTKSVSRFARNTVDSLTTVRKLKEKGVEVYFQKENIYTLDSKGELLITIMSSLAQEESRSISENVTWGQRKRFADGKVSLAYGRFLGYERGEDGKPIIVEREARTVRLIYRLFLEGKTPNRIAKLLTDRGIPTPSGKTKWQPSTISSILKNEKYKGDALLQKSYTIDFLSKKTKVNEGEVPQYYVFGSHDAIISPEVFDLVQHEFERRKNLGVRYSSNSIFSSKIICGECGGFYGSKVWNSTNRYRHTVWRCNNKYGREKSGGLGCKTPHVDEELIKRLFVEAFNRQIMNRAEIIESCRSVLLSLTDTKKLEAELHHRKTDRELTAELIRKCVEENARFTVDQDEYKGKYDSLISRYEAAKAECDSITSKINERAAKRVKINDYMDLLSKRSQLLTEFDEDLWCVTVESLTVYSKERMILRFKDGSEVVCSAD